MIIISNQSAATYSQKIAAHLGLPFLPSTIITLTNNEIELTLASFQPVAKCVLIIGFNGDSNKTLIELMLHVAELKKREIKEVYLFLPYFIYSRQCSKKNIVGPTVKLINDIIFKDKIIKKIITLDLHADSIHQINLKLHEITHFDIFSSFIPKHYTVVSPDEGGARRLKPYIFHQYQTALLKKTRLTHGKISIEGRAEEFCGKDCIIIDDIVDSANTICSAAEFLKKSGAKKIEVFVSHSLLNSESIFRIEASYIDLVIINNMQPNWLKCKKINIVNVDGIIANHLQSINLKGKL